MIKNVHADVLAIILLIVNSHLYPQMHNNEGTIK